MRSRMVMSVLAAVAAVAVVAGACAGSGVADDPTGTSKVVQIVSVSLEPQQPECTVVLDGPPRDYGVVFHMHIVNTTDETMTVTNVASVGHITNATASAEIGNPAHVFGTLPFSPTPTILRANDGDLIMDVTLTDACGVSPTPAQLAFREIEMSLRVTTTEGQYVTEPFRMRVIYRPPPTPAAR